MRRWQQQKPEKVGSQSWSVVYPSPLGWKDIDKIARSIRGEGIWHVTTLVIVMDRVWAIVADTSQTRRSADQLDDTVCAHYPRGQPANKELGPQCIKQVF